MRSIILVALLLCFTQVLGLPAEFLKVSASAETGAVKIRRNGESGGEQRYKDICQVHNIDSQMFPGALGNPICPYWNVIPMYLFLKTEKICFGFNKKCYNHQSVYFYVV